MPCAYILSVLLVPLSFSVSNGSFFSTGCRFYSSSYRCLFGFVPVLRLPSLTLRCLAVESSGCVSSSNFVLGGSSSFILLCFVSFILNFVRGFHLFLPFLVILFFLGFCPQCFPVLCWLRLLALPLQCLLPSIFRMSSFLPLQVLVWALWWLQVLWCKILMTVVFIPFCTFSTAGSGYPIGGGGGGVLSLLRSSSCSDLRGRFPVAILLSSGSWSGKFPIERCYLWG